MGFFRRRRRPAAACQTCAVETIPLAVEREGVSADDVPAV